VPSLLNQSREVVEDLQRTYYAIYSAIISISYTIEEQINVFILYSENEKNFSYHVFQNRLYKEDGMPFTIR